jgi:hypothetical protein
MMRLTRNYRAWHGKAEQKKNQTKTSSSNNENENL